MEIINVPISDYLKVCKKAAFQRGFDFIMVLLARELDATSSYTQLKRYWNSFNDLTGEKILFIVSTANQKGWSYSMSLIHESERWRVINNPNLMILNQNALDISRFDFPTQMTIKEYRKMAIENNTNYISDLCQELDIREEDVPSIVIFSTFPYSKEKPYIIPIKQDDLYSAIKGFIIGIQPELEKVRHYRNKAKEISIELKDLKRKKQECMFTNSERRYLKAKAELLRIIKTESDNNTSLLQEAIKKRDIRACKQFPQPIRGYLNQIIDLQKMYPDIESNVTKKQTNNEIEIVKISNLEEAQRENWKLIEKSYRELVSAIERYISEKRKVSIHEKSMNNHIPHFKIGVTFSGQYRKRYVEPFCRELLNIGYTQDEIFYDSWHDVLINGINGDDILRQIYLKNCDCVVVLLSPDYKENNWTGNIEWRAVKELINTGKDSKICLLRVDSADIEAFHGLYHNQAIVKDIDNMSAKEIAAFINSKYEKMFD